MKEYHSPRLDDLGLFTELGAKPDDKILTVEELKDKVDELVNHIRDSWSVDTSPNDNTAGGDDGQAANGGI